MTPKTLRNRLDALADSERFVYECYKLAAACEKKLTRKSVEVIVDFMADHPEIDYGMPGPLTHLAETFDEKEYEEIICKSVSTKPTPQTLVMLQRVLNGAKTAREKAGFITVLKQARIKAAGDRDLIEDIDELLPPAKKKPKGRSSR